MAKTPVRAAIRLTNFASMQRELIAARKALRIADEFMEVASSIDPAYDDMIKRKFRTLRDKVRS